MAQLILTDEEKAAKNWLDVSDDCLGKVCRKTMLMLPNVCKLDAEGKSGVWFMSCLNVLIGLAHDSNSETTELKVTGFTEENKECGDWKVTIKRTDKRRTSNPKGLRTRHFVEGTQHPLVGRPNDLSETKTGD